MFIETHLDVSCVVWTVEDKKSLQEYPRKNPATPIEANTTVTHPTFKGIWLLDKYFHPCKLVHLQNWEKFESCVFWLSSSSISSSISKIRPFFISSEWILVFRTDSEVVENVPPFWFIMAFLFFLFCVIGKPSYLKVSYLLMSIKWNVYHIIGRYGLIILATFLAFSWSYFITNGGLMWMNEWCISI